MQKHLISLSLWFYTVFKFILFIKLLLIEWGSYIRVRLKAFGIVGIAQQRLLTDSEGHDLVFLPHQLHHHALL